MQIEAQHRTQGAPGGPPGGPPDDATRFALPPSRQWQKDRRIRGRVAPLLRSGKQQQQQQQQEQEQQQQEQMKRSSSSRRVVDSNVS
ncbi:hypothetical protein Emed_006954 [Eimeria media]